MKKTGSDNPKYDNDNNYVDDGNYDGDSPEYDEDDDDEKKESENEVITGITAKKRLSPLAKFFIALFATLALFLVGGLVFLLTYGSVSGTTFNENVKAVAKAIESNLKGVSEGTKSNPITNLFQELQEHTNFAVLGMDSDGTRSDVIVVGTFNSKTEEVTLVSVPRDTYTVMTADKRKILNDAGLWTPSSGVMKFNAVTHYAGKELAMPFVVKQLEELFSIKIEYFVKIDLEAFRFIVDEIGGVTFDVPQRMYYNDPEQDLYIDLQPGLQLLSGSQAEGLVRYRKADANNPISPGYPMADLQRVKVQQDFIKALINQILTKDLIKNIPTLFDAMNKYVDTNFTLADISKYTKFASGFDTEAINTFTLPGSTDGSDYYMPDYAAIMELTSQYFTSATKTDNTEVGKALDSERKDEISSVGMKIQVLNGGDVAGLAARTRDTLTDAGFNVTSIGDYYGDRAKETRIIVRGEGQGGDLLKYFENAEVVVDGSISESYDIVIVLGTE